MGASGKVAVVMAYIFRSKPTVVIGCRSWMRWQGPMMCIVANEEGEEGRGVTEGVTVYSYCTVLLLLKDARVVGMHNPRKNVRWDDPCVQ